MAYTGKFVPINKKKYIGRVDGIYYRSLWERQVMKWMDVNPDVVTWSSEEFYIPYKCKTDNKVHRYFPDFKVEFKNGMIVVIEIKPRKQTIEPKPPKKQTKQYLYEVLGYIKNTSKWESATKYCEDRKWLFQIWHEDTIRSLGIKLLT